MQLAYRKTSGSATTWPEPLEGIYQSQSRGRRLPGAQRRDITVPARLLIAAVVALGRQRPHGMITWLAGAWRTSRQTIYAIGERIEQQLEEAEQEAGEAAAAVLSRDELAGATLTLLIAGTMTVRRVRWCLARLLGREPSVGWVSDLVAEAGSRAEKALRRADWSGTPMMIAARDELYDGDFAYLLMVDPVSLAIIHGEVVDKVDSDTWSLALADGVQRTSFRVEVGGGRGDALPAVGGWCADARRWLRAPSGPEGQLAPAARGRHSAARDRSRCVARARTRRGQGYAARGEQHAAHLRMGLGGGA